MYIYREELPNLLTDEGQRDFIHNRDVVLARLNANGAILSGKVMAAFKGRDTFFHMACFDRMIEIKDIAEVTGPNVMGQHRVFVKA